MSIKQGLKYYWAKLLDKKAGDQIYGVQLSTDGGLLIAHSNTQFWSFIVVFNVSSGNTLSGRLYSKAGNYNFNYLIKSMAISKGPSPKAFVLTMYYDNTATGVNDCQGQIFFSFNPVTGDPAWTKDSLGGQSSCYNLGLTLGRDDLFLYAYSVYNLVSTLSLMGIDGSTKWQCTTQGANLNNLIQYKNLDASTDMVVVTDGTNPSGGT